MKIFVVNAGSSSLKYQLIDMDDKSVIVKGLCERIGIDGIIKLQKPDGSKFEAEYNMPDHTTAFKKVMPDIYKAYLKQVSSRRFTIA